MKTDNVIEKWAKYLNEYFIKKKFKRLKKVKGA